MMAMLESFGLSHKTTQNRLRYGVPSSPPVDQALVELMGRMIDMLPDDTLTTSLVDIYFSRMDCLTHVLHQEAYMNELGRMMSTTPPGRPAAVRPGWLAIHLSILCLAFHMLEAGEADRFGVSQDELQLRAHAYYNASHDLLFGADFLTNHSLEYLQCIILQGVYLFNTEDGPDRHYAIVGSALKIAYNLGLNRLGPETVPNLQWPRVWQDPIQRDLGRRVWWSLIWYDWQLSTVYCSTYSASPAFNFAALPGNHDELPITDSVGALPVAALPIQEYTSASCFIFRRHYDTIQRENVDHRREHEFDETEYVRRASRRLDALRSVLPPHFQSLSGAQDAAARLDRPVVVYEYFILRSIHLARVLRVHKHHLLLSYSDRTLFESGQKGAAAAKETLLDFHSAWTECPPLLNYCKCRGLTETDVQGLFLYNGYFAAAIMFFHLCYGLADHQQQACRNLLQQTVYIFRQITISTTARNAVHIIEGLLAAEKDMRGSSPSQTEAIHDATDRTRSNPMARRALERILGIGRHAEASDNPATVENVVASDPIIDVDFASLLSGGGWASGDIDPSIFPPGGSDLDALLGLFGLDPADPAPYHASPFP
ncbi:putative transcription factor lepB [Vanrija pseudolonga]|uniref:Transcription factor lepB n=1 Tax=Vanrija pseudolonga TaxID=143232 RepID=A0AAF0YC28_9TREE|nr:putative transcription factor lepB [Vanrija pseudolonga]